MEGILTEKAHKLATSQLLWEIDEQKLEQESQTAYRLIAGEYYNEEHMTCRAFDFLDQRILDAYQQRYGLVKGGKQYLEVGSGAATLLRRVLPADSSLVVGDLCTQMAQRSRPLPGNMAYEHFSAFNLPYEENHFHGVFAFLADSYNAPRFYKEAWRVLRGGGFLLMTCPTRLWAKTLREGDGDSLHYAGFTTLEGRIVFIPSITWSREDYFQLLECAGFSMLVYEEFCLPSEYPSSHIPDTIRVPAEQLGTAVSCMPLVTALLAQK